MSDTTTAHGPQAGRHRADFPEGTVVFLIGMRINSLWRIHHWLPVFLAMPRMIAELSRNRDLGLLGVTSWFGGRSFMVQQYWASMDRLMAYAVARDAEHLPAWKRFNQRVAATPSVGIWHEAYIVDPNRSHIVYRHMPAFGMGKATRKVPVQSMPPQPIRGREGAP